MQSADEQPLACCGVGLSWWRDSSTLFCCTNPRWCHILTRALLRPGSVCVCVCVCTVRVSKLGSLSSVCRYLLPF
ncbi:hypothetical protein L209DRAFT_567354 [Thermothelomyces heterothallicus CBS 203.75]